MREQERARLIESGSLRWEKMDRMSSVGKPPIIDDASGALLMS